MGTINFVTSRNTVTVTGDIIYPPSVTLRLRNCYVTPCYAVTSKAKRELKAVTLVRER